jgi:hypothetical protein
MRNQFRILPTVSLLKKELIKRAAGPFYFLRLETPNETPLTTFEKFAQTGIAAGA